MIRAFAASIVATTIVSVLVYVNARMGVVPQLDLLGQLASFNERLGLPSTIEALWTTHAVLGIVVYGLLFALIQPILPGNGLLAGSIFGALLWLAMMVSFMPLAGHEPFARDLGIGGAVASLALHLIYGGALGLTYAMLASALR